MQGGRSAVRKTRLDRRASRLGLDVGGEGARNALAYASKKKAFKMDTGHIEFGDTGGPAEPPRSGFRLDFGAVLLALFVVCTAYVLSR